MREEFRNIQLPEKAFAVILDKVEIKSSLILDDEVTTTDFGTVVLAGPDLQDKLEQKVRVRVNFGEEMFIRGIKVLYFRDFESSIYYTDGE